MPPVAAPVTAEASPPEAPQQGVGGDAAAAAAAAAAGVGTGSGMLVDAAGEMAWRATLEELKTALEACDEGTKASLLSSLARRGAGSLSKHGTHVECVS